MITRYEKRFRTSSGTLTEQTIHISDENFRDKDQRILDISKLSTMIAKNEDLGFIASEFTSEEFALSLIEGVEKVSFSIAEIQR